MFSPMQTQPFEVSDFSGGMTDNYMDCRPNQFQIGDNLLITDNRKLLTRPGSEIVSTTNYLPTYVGTNERTGLLFVFEDMLFENQGRCLYYNNSGYTTISGPTSNPALPAGTTASRSSWAYWNHHLLLTSDAFGSPQKMYKDGAGVFQIRNAGLPALATSPTCTGSIASILAFANDLKAKFNAHLADVAQHTTGADALNVITSANATNLATLITLVTEMITDYTAHDADSQLAVGWAFHRAKSTVARSLASAIPPTTLAECLTRLSDISSKFNAHDVDATTHAVGASHQVILSAPVSRSYIYAFLYSYQYTVGTAVFKDYGPTTLVQVEGVDMPSVTNLAIAAIPTLANGATENYATTVIKVEIYRTIDGGQTLYYVGEVTNGTAVFTDSVSDTTLQSNTVIYTDGDVLENDPPPKAKYLVVANDICWYMHVKEGTEVKTNRVRQSHVYDIDACPASFYTDLEDEIMGGANIGIYPIVFCKERIYRLEGYFDLLGQGGISKQEISRTAGCVSHLSIVVTLEGIFWAGVDGFYWTNGYQVQKISQEINTTYSEIVVTATQKKNIYGAYDTINKRIYWAAQRDQSSADNDAYFIADLKTGVRQDTPFTTASGGTSFAPSAIAFYNKVLYRADRRGYLFVHGVALTTDPKVNTLAVPSLWSENAIIYDYKSAATNFGTILLRKWVPSLVLNCKNSSNMSIGIKGFNDDSSGSHELKEVRYTDNIIWGNSRLQWGDASLTWNSYKMIKAFRRFPALTLRCSYKQLQLTNSYTVITNSDSIGTANVDATAKTATLTTASTDVWPAESVDYYISFIADLYVKQYLVTAVSGTVLTYSDIANTSATALGTKWLLKGYQKNDILDLLNYSLNFAPLSSTQDPYRTADSGANV